MPASCAARATLTSGTAAPARTARVFDGDVAKAAAEPDHHARHAAVAHDQIGAEPDHGHGNVAGQICQQIGEIGLILRHEQDLRRPADAKPGQFGKRLVRQQPAAQRRHVWLADRRRCRESSCGAPRLPRRAMPPAHFPPSSRVAGPRCVPACASRADRCRPCRVRRCGRPARFRSVPARSPDEIATQAAMACAQTPAPDNAASTRAARSPPATRNCRRANAAPALARAAPAPSSSRRRQRQRRPADLLTGPGATRAPSAAAIICAPRQMPSIGLLAAMRAAMAAISSAMNG